MFDTTLLKHEHAATASAMVDNDDEIIDLCSDDTDMEPSISHTNPVKTEHHTQSHNHNTSSLLDTAIFDDETSDVDKEHKHADQTESSSDKQQYVFDDKFHCSNCHEQFEEFSDAYTHPVLSIPVCKDCYHYVKAYDLDADLDDDGTRQYCTWCADGGEMLLCDNEHCRNVFCSQDVINTFGKKRLKQIQGQDVWLCFVCDTSQLESIVNDFNDWKHRHGMKLQTKKRGRPTGRRSKRGKYVLLSDEGLTDSDTGSRPRKKSMKSDKSKSKRPKKEKPPKKAKSQFERRQIKQVKDDREFDTAAHAAQKAEAKRLAMLSGETYVSSESEHEIIDVGDSDEFDDTDVQIQNITSSQSNGTTVGTGTILVNTLYERFKEQAVYINPDIGPKLKQHQIDGVRFMWNNIVQNIQEAKSNPTSGLGCIISHFMGLGKTLTTITFIDIYWRQLVLGKCILIIVPVNVLQNWDNEFHKWLRKSKQRPPLYRIDKCPSNNDKLYAIQMWEEQGGVLLMGYETYNLIAQCLLTQKHKTNSNTTKQLQARKQMANILIKQTSLLIADEGHRIKNSKTKIQQTMKLIQTPRKIILSGTPMQNNLNEFYTMIDYIRPNFFGQLKQFRNQFAIPIGNGLCADSTIEDVKLSQKRTYILHNKTRGFIHRITDTAPQAETDLIEDEELVVSRLMSNTTQQLLPKYDYVLFITLSDLQNKLYKAFLTETSYQQRQLFQSFSMLAKIWSHPDAAYYGMLREDNKLRDKYSTTAMKQFVVSDNTVDTEQKENNQSFDNTNATTSNVLNNSLRAETRSKFGFAKQIFTDSNNYITNQVQYSGKMLITLYLIRTCLDKNDKIVIFSQNLIVLNILECLFQQLWAWKAGVNWFRLDGGTKPTKRQAEIDVFNRPDSKPKVYLISTKAGSLGVNLIGANHAVIYDCSWNPSIDSQAVYRIYRYGQTKPVTIYRLISSGTMEQKVYDRQIHKSGVSLRVVDESEVSRLYSAQELLQLYTYVDEEENATLLASDVVKNAVNEQIQHNDTNNEATTEKSTAEKLVTFAPDTVIDRSGGQLHQDTVKNLRLHDEVMAKLLAKFGNTSLREMATRSLEQLDIGYNNDNNTENSSSDETEHKSVDHSDDSKPTVPVKQENGAPTKPDTFIPPTVTVNEEQKNDSNDNVVHNDSQSSDTESEHEVSRRRTSARSRQVRRITLNEDELETYTVDPDSNNNGSDNDEQSANEDNDVTFSSTDTDSSEDEFLAHDIGMYSDDSDDDVLLVDSEYESDIEYGKKSKKKKRDPDRLSSAPLKTFNKNANYSYDENEKCIRKLLHGKGYIRNNELDIDNCTILNKTWIKDINLPDVLLADRKEFKISESEGQQAVVEWDAPPPAPTSPNAKATDTTTGTTQQLQPTTQQIQQSNSTSTSSVQPNTTPATQLNSLPAQTPQYVQPQVINYTPHDLQRIFPIQRLHQILHQSVPFNAIGDNKLQIDVLNIYWNQMIVQNAYTLNQLIHEQLCNTIPNSTPTYTYHNAVREHFDKFLTTEGLQLWLEDKRIDMEFEREQQELLRKQQEKKAALQARRMSAPNRTVQQTNNTVSTQVPSFITQPLASMPPDATSQQSELPPLESGSQSK